MVLKILYVLDDISISPKIIIYLIENHPTPLKGGWIVDIF